MKKNNKYLKELGVDFYNCPFGYHEEKTENERIKNWKIQKKVYGFDERETWDLEYTFAIWLYSRIRMYEEISDIDMNTCTIKFRDETMSINEGIDIIKRGCKRYIDLKSSIVDDKKNEPKEWKDAVDLFTENMRLFWW